MGKIDDEFILVLQKINDVSVLADDDSFISDIVKYEMIKFSKQIKAYTRHRNKGGRKPTKRDYCKI